GPMRKHVSQQMQACDRLMKLEKRWPRLMTREDKPASARESLDIATMCGHRRMYAAAARFAAEAFAAGPKLADDLGGQPPFIAACAAACAAAGKGEDAAKLDDKERTRLRKQALDWLRADLALRRKQLKSWWPGEAEQARAALALWQKEADLASIRDKAALAKL